MVAEPVIERRVDCATGLAADWELDGDELARVEELQREAVRRSARQRHVNGALHRLRVRAREGDRVVADLLTVLGLGRG